MDKYRSLLNTIKPDIYSVIDGWDDIDSSVKNFLSQFTERELKEIYIMLEDPYSTENLLRAQGGIEYSNLYWEKWEMAVATLHPKITLTS